MCQKLYLLFKADKNRIEECCAANIVYMPVNHIEQYSSEPEQSLTMLNNIVDNYEHCGQYKIV